MCRPSPRKRLFTAAEMLKIENFVKISRLMATTSHTVEIFQDTFIDMPTGF